MKFQVLLGQMCDIYSNIIMVTVDLDRNYVWSNKIDLKTLSP